MKEQNLIRLKCGIKGSALCAAFCSAAYSLSAIIFSEMKNVTASTIAMLILSFVSAGTYLILEKTAVFTAKIGKLRGTKG